MSKELEQLRRDLRRSSRWLHGAGHEPSHEELARVAAWCQEQQIDADVYGEGEGLQAFEAHVAKTLGYPAGRFMPSGSMAQPIALRIWSERTGRKRFGMHPTCHIELHEEHGYAQLHGLHSVLLGADPLPMYPSDLEACHEALGTLVVELPTRENGGRLAGWSELVELTTLARERDIRTHLDGARLWEAAAGYQRPLEEICELFDSAYVSFYKGIGALSGAMLFGPEDFIEEAKLWQRRQGGNLYSLLPNWASAAMRFDGQLSKFGSYRERAQDLAQSLRGLPELRINPDPPQVNLCHLWLEGDRETLLLARDRVAEECGLWLFGGLRPTGLPEFCKFELYIGEAAMRLENVEVEAAFRSLFEHARED